MVSHQPSCRRWRACMAMHNLVAPREGRSCKLFKQSGGFPKEHWESLGSFISAMGSPDLVFKTEALHRLSLFLLYVAPTSESSFTCPDAFTISIHFKNKGLFLPLKDIQVLYKILFSELTSYTAWLFRQEAGAKESESKLSSFCSSQCDCIHLVLLVEVLHCCIRILPLLEFNTGLSLVAAETLISVLKQLCCPTNLCHLSAKGFDDVVECYRNQLLKTPHGSNEVQAHSYFENGHERSGAAVSWISSMEASIKGLQEHLSSHENMEIPASHMFGGNIMACSIHDTKTHTDRAHVACALLEVFMDELLLQPGLIDVLLASNVDAKLDSSSSGFSCGKHVQLTMEAAAVHFILSFSGFNYVELLQGNFETRHSAHYVSGMSLPAAVMLFDLSVADAVRAPYIFLVHIVNTLRRSLDSTSCLSPELPGEMVLGLAASVLESAVSLYSRFWTPCPLPTQHYNELQHGELINSLYDKFWAICDGDRKKIASVLELLFDEESFSKPGQQECTSTYPSAGFSCVADATFFGDERLESSYHAIQSACFHTRQDATSVYSGQEQEKILPTHTDCFSPSGSTYIVSNAALLVSVLQLMSAALLRLVAEAYKQDPRSKAIHFPETATQEAPDGGHSCVNAELYIDNAKEAFKFCASMDRMKMLKDLKLDKQLQKLFYEGDEVTGHAFTFFVERLCLSFKQGAPKALCQAYLDVLKSLITLLTFTEQRRKMANPSYDTHVCEDLHVCPDDATMKKSDEEQNWEKPCNSGRQHNVVEFMSSTLIMTKKYQRKRRYITSTQKSSQRLNEARLSAEHKRVGSCSSPLKLQEEGTFRRHKPAVHKNSSSNDGNAYIEEMIANEGKVDGECFSDLSDFIVCKEGRDYSKWMKSIYKKRKKKLRRTYWERLKAKRALISLLTCQGNDHF